MKLALKIACVIWVGIVVVIGIDAFFSMRRDLQIFRSDMVRDARQYGRIVQGIASSLWQERGGRDAFNFLREAAKESQPMRIRLVLPNVAPDDPRAPIVGNLGPRALLPGAEVVIEAPKVGSEGLLVTYRPLVVGGEVKALLEIAEPMTELHNYARATLWRSLVLMAAALLASAALIVVAGWRMVGRPLQRLMEKTRQIGEGDFSGKLVLPGHGELSSLAASLDRMCRQLEDSRRKLQEESEARIAALDQLRHTERLATVGRLAAGMAHELGTPLNVVTGRAQIIAGEDLGREDTVRNATIISEQARRMTTLMRQLLDFARSGTPNRQPTSMENLVRGVFEMIAATARPHDLKLEIEASPSLPPVSVDPGKMQQVLTNLVLNAIQATPPDGSVTVILHQVLAARPGKDARPCLAIEVRDTGPGIPEEHLDQLFEPFFTTKEVGEGTGLGLSIAYGIVQEHDGWIEAANLPAGGACFTVYLPQEETS